jgi:hypothetical protein
MLGAAHVRAQTPPPAPGAGHRLFGVESDELPPLAPPPVQQVVMRLDFTGIPGCSNPEPFRLTVRSIVRGWNAFAPNAPWRLVLVVKRRMGHYEGFAELHDATDRVEWVTPVPIKPTCVELLDDLGALVALTLDPPRDTPPAPPPPPAPSLPPPPLEGPPPSPPLALPSEAPLPVRPPLERHLGLGAGADFASAPRVSLGLTLDAGVRVGRLSVSGELRWSPPAGATLSNGAEISVTRILGALVTCGNVGQRPVFVGCLLGELGQIQWSNVAPAPVRAPGHHTGLYVAGGARLGVQIPLPSPLHVQVSADLLGAAKPLAIRIPESTRLTGGIVGSLGGGVGMTF